MIVSTYNQQFSVSRILFVSYCCFIIPVRKSWYHLLRYMYKRFFSKHLFYWKFFTVFIFHLKQIKKNVMLPLIGNIDQYLLYV